jgi:hypothetical protein
MIQDVMHVHRTRGSGMLKIVLACFLAFLIHASWAQVTVPFQVVNTSTFPDTDLYVAVVGINYTTGAHIWIDPRNSQILPMDRSYNTVAGPTPNGNMGPGGDGRYANCFARLSDIPNKTFNLPPIAGCRVFISRGSQLYFYFFGSTGAPSGYTAPDHLNPNDPNKGIMFEIIELTNNQYGFFGNTSRVDAFKYPMGLELYGTNGYYKKVGELKTKDQIIADFRANVPAEFQGCVNSLGEIWAPSKTAAFQDGTNGTTPGPYANYLKPYIDQIWEKYKTVDMVFNAGEAGTFRCRVVGEELQCREINGGFEGKTGKVIRRPTTQEALEGKGVLDNGSNPDTRTVDLVVQAQLTAAINRHVVDVTTAVPGTQNWHDKSRFYPAAPMNYYARFWHLPGICIDQLAYGFAYDDVADHSPSLHTPVPTRVVAVFGGYSGSCTATAINPYLSINGGAWQNTSTASLNAGGSITFGPQPTDGTWRWTGPSGYTSTSRQITIANIQSHQAGSYRATYTNSCGAQSVRDFVITVNAVGPTVYQDCNFGGTASSLPVGNYTTAQLSARGIPNNWVSSVRVPAGYTVTLYDGDNLTGASRVLTADNSCLVNNTFNDLTSSISVAQTPASTPTLYQDCNYSGTGVSLPVGTYTTAQLSARGIPNNWVSSLRIPSGYTVALYDGDNLTGASRVLTSDYSCLVNNTFNDLTSSVQVSQGTSSGPCSGTAANGDYRYQVSTTGGSVTWTFIPQAPIAGSTMAILYVRTGSSTTFAGYTMAASGSNFVYTLPVAGGTAITFYFTYRVGNTTTERNSSASPHTYTAGATCAAGTVATLEEISSFEEEVTLYPNAVESTLNLPVNAKGAGVRILDQSGRALEKRVSSENTVDVSDLSPGVYIVLLREGNRIRPARFVKK